MIRAPSLSLPRVTLCAVTSVNIAATIEALAQCRQDIDFGSILLLTDAILPDPPSWLELIPINKIKSSKDYSEFIIKNLINYIETDYLIIIQWDGFIINSKNWSDEFLSYDYIGAIWPQFADQANVGNGGFSLRSKRLVDACQDSSFVFKHPEDVCICRNNRFFLEEKYGIRFAPEEVAEKFSWERRKSGVKTFGFHGIFNMMAAVGPNRFADIYLNLDESSSSSIDFRKILWEFITNWRAIGLKKTTRILSRLLRDRILALKITRKSI